MMWHHAPNSKSLEVGFRWNVKRIDRNMMFLSNKDSVCVYQLPDLSVLKGGENLFENGFSKFRHGCP